MEKRPRIQKKMYTKGDVVRGRLPSDEVGQSHVCIVLQDSTANGHTSCIPVCNFTGSEPIISGFSIDISNYELPENWFDKKKPTSWIFCNMQDCIRATLQAEEKLGNLPDQFPKLWEEVCHQAYSCAESERLQYACDCHFEEIKKAVVRGEIESPECNCNS